ncbi:UPF0164 family protein [Gordonia desulfuricans]|uniref:UPF0164 family protein n=1 Tax=Gordonia desulfuricans TaxID=89051 RepID=A0A7K3LRX6_9ACTN|nr:hypothetical protein [Gordonia desulfuricans]NDK91024.1 UPF0164 family protein [Gordonia desulfuricans]
MSALYQLDPPLGAVDHVVVRDCTPLADIPDTPGVAITNVAHTAEVFAATPDGTAVDPDGWALFQFSDIHDHADVLARFGYTITEETT